MNNPGSDLYIRKQFEFSNLKSIWDKVVLNVIGENLEDEEELVGCRIVNR